MDVNEQVRMRSKKFLLKLRKYLLKITIHLIVYDLYFTFTPSY